MEELLSTLHTELAKWESPLDQLRAFIELHLKVVENDPQLADVLAVELRQSSKFVREYRAHKFYEYLALAEQILNQGISEGMFREGINAKVYRRALFGALDELTVMWVACAREGRSPPCDLSTAAKDIYEIFISGLTDSSSEATDRSTL